eukprot:45681-Chlamydomonas_euryale.AAC.1
MSRPAARRNRPLLSLSSPFPRRHDRPCKHRCPDLQRAAIVPSSPCPPPFPAVMTGRASTDVQTWSVTQPSPLPTITPFPSKRHGRPCK